MNKVQNNYPIGMFPPINSFVYPTDMDEWLYCPKCGLQPRVWEFHNGRFTHCGCSKSTFDHFSVTAKSIVSVLRESESGGDARKYDRDELKNNWNRYCVETTDLSENLSELGLSENNPLKID